MNKKLIAVAVVLAGLGMGLGGCAVTTGGGYVVQRAPASAPMVAEDDGAPPMEYVVEGEQPVYYDIEPGIAFYPVYFGYPGSCFCIMPVRWYGGVWYGPGHYEIYRGHFAGHYAGVGHLNAWREGHGTFRGHTATHGQMQRGPGGRVHAVPPTGGVHARPSGGPAQQHVTPQTHSAPQQHSAPQVHTPQVQRPAPQVQRPQPQARPPQVQRPAPQRAPAPQRQCRPGQKC